MDDERFKKTLHAMYQVQRKIEGLCKAEVARKSPAAGSLSNVDYEKLTSNLVGVLAVLSDDLDQQLWSEIGEVDRFISDLNQQIDTLTKERDAAVLQRAKIDHPSSPSVRSAVHALTDGHCAYCDDELGDDWQVEHVVPASLGGPDSLANYVPSCRPCNHKKGTKHVIEFIKLKRGKFVVVHGDKDVSA